MTTTGGAVGQGFACFLGPLCLFLAPSLLLKAALLGDNLFDCLGGFVLERAGVGLVAHPHLIEDLEEFRVFHAQLFSELINTNFRHPNLLKPWVIRTKRFTPLPWV